MNPRTISEILALIEQAEAVRDSALSVENRDSLGWPYVCGYNTSTLNQIKEILSQAQK